MLSMSPGWVDAAVAHRASIICLNFDVCPQPSLTKRASGLTLTEYARVHPMTWIDISALRNQFSQIIDRASKGESFIITRSGAPLAKLMPPDGGKPSKIRFGLMKGLIHIGSDFDAPLDDFEEDSLA